MEAGQGPNWSCSAKGKEKPLYVLLVVVVVFLGVGAVRNGVCKSD
jgi:hypothetical protein